jgi:hypothetical protein
MKSTYVRAVHKWLSSSLRVASLKRGRVVGEEEMYAQPAKLPPPTRTGET